MRLFESFDASGSPVRISFPIPTSARLKSWSRRWIAVLMARRSSSLIFPHCDTEVFQAFLDTMAAEAPALPGRQVLLVLDNASWHKTKSLEWHHLKPVHIPPYSPDFNPIERFWQHLKSHYLAGYLTRSGQALGDKVYNSISDLLGLPEIIRSVCRTHSP